MKQITGYLRSFVAGLDPRIFLLTALFMALAIFANYHYGLNAAIGGLPQPMEYAAWYGVFFLAYSLPLFLYAAFGRHRLVHDGPFLFLWLVAPAIFAWKMAAEVKLGLDLPPSQEIYWNHVLYWPIKLVVVTTVLLLVWKISRDPQPFYGFDTRQFSPRPYFLMLLVMVPLIALASTQPDFLRMYPKLKNMAFLHGPHTVLYRLLYELSYGSDFFSIELFFRGFLVLAFVRWLGPDAILPMACFYCAIHFGKPLGECISSFFGGLILGVVTYRTRTIWGGLIVHLGIAWLMELGGYLGHSWR